MADVFISYSKTDGDAVRRLADAVRQLGYEIWWDEELPPHLSYSDVIAEKIEAAKAAIVVWSESSAASQWVRAEADLARNQAKLIQASIDGRLPPMPFNQIQCAEIGDWAGEDDHLGWVKIRASLTALCGLGEGGAPVRPPAAPAVPPRPVLTAPPRRGGAWLVPLLLGLLILAVMGVGYLVWAQDDKRAGPRDQWRYCRPERFDPVACEKVRRAHGR